MESNKIIIRIFFLNALLLMTTLVLAQIGYSIPKAGSVKVQIRNFYKSPPDCGVLKNIAIYEAEVVDSTSLLMGTKILVCVECKADLYSTLTGTQFLLKIAGECTNVHGAYNFTDYTDDALATMKKYQVLYLSAYRQDD